MVEITDDDKPKTLEQRVEGEDKYYGRPHYKEFTFIQVEHKKILIAQHIKNDGLSAYCLNGSKAEPRNNGMEVNFIDIDGTTFAEIWNNTFGESEFDKPCIAGVYSLDGFCFADRDSAKLNKEFCNNGAYGGPHFEIKGVIDVGNEKLLMAMHERYDALSVYSSDSRNHWFGGPHSSRTSNIVYVNGKTYLRAYDRVNNIEEDGTFTAIYSLEGIFFHDKKHITNMKADAKTYERTRKWLRDNGKINRISIEIVEKISEYTLVDKCRDIFGVDYDDMLNSIVGLLQKGGMAISSHVRLVHSGPVHFLLDVVDKYSESGKNKLNLVESVEVALKTEEGDTQRRFMCALNYNMTLKREDRNTLTEILECTSIHIAGYAILRRLGEGADSVVYQARHDILGDVKVKIFKTKPLSKIKKAIEQEGVSLEERIRRRIALFDKRVRDKTHITQLYDVGKCRDPKTDEDTFYIVSDYVDGGSIEYKKEDGTYGIRNDIVCETIIDFIYYREGFTHYVIDARKMIHIFRMMISGLRPIHDAGMILRDIKLGNTLLSRDHKTLLIDDLETIAELDKVRAGSRLTEGSDRYSAPEVMQDIRNASQQSDLYSLAVCFLYIMTRNPTLMASINTLPEKEYKKALNTMLDKQILSDNQKAFFKKALAYSPEKRYKNAAKLENGIGCLEPHFPLGFLKLYL